MPIDDQILPALRRRSKRFNALVVALAYDGLRNFEFACTAEVFGLPRPELGPEWYRFETCALEGRRVRGEFGFTMTVDAGLERLANAGTIVIPGWQGIDVPVAAPILDALRDAHHRGARLVSICSGSFVLAATGLLDGKRATTHWRYAAELQSRHPGIRVDSDVLYIDEGRVLTSAGSAAGLDLCLHVVRRDYGAAAANHVARRLVIAPHRDGGQVQFLDRPVNRRERGSMSALLERVQRRLHEPVGIRDMADWAAMSERTFMRRFRAATGMTPADWITRTRVDRAREMLECTALTVDEIATQTGLGTPTTLRHHFRNKVGLSPVEYRRRFSRSAPGVS